MHFLDDAANRGIYLFGLLRSDGMYQLVGMMIHFNSRKQAASINYSGQ